MKDYQIASQRCSASLVQPYYFQNCSSAGLLCWESSGIDLWILLLPISESPIPSLLCTERNKEQSKVDAVWHSQTPT